VFKKNNALKIANIVAKGPQMGFIILFASYRSTQFGRQSQTDSAAISVSVLFIVGMPGGHMTKVSWKLCEIISKFHEIISKFHGGFGRISYR
jgi:hypothetical protein